MQTVTEILIDFSQSMDEKLALTKSALLNDIIPELDYSSKIAIKTFTGTKEKLPIIKEVLPLSITNKEQLLNAINSLQNPDGNTPIAAAIKNSVISLKEYAAFNKTILLITDGEENCGGDYLAEVDIAKKDGINCHIHIIGIGLNEQAAKKAESISTLSNGSFNAIPFTKGQTVYNQNVVRQHLTSFYKAVKQPVLQKSNLASAMSASTNNSTLQQDFKKINDTAAETLKPTEDVLSTDGSLNFIIEEIKEIRKELNGLKNDKEQVPEFVEDEELNERIRKASEEYLFEILKKKYPERVNWLNQSGESYLDHDFEILNFDGSVEYYIECKGTGKAKPTFYLTKEEWRLFLNHTKNYQIYFVNNSFNNPTYIFIDNLLDWMLKGKIVPYLIDRQVIKEERVFLTHIDL
jgi:hypothetical protein